MALAFKLRLFPNRIWNLITVDDTYIFRQNLTLRTFTSSFTTIGNTLLFLRKPHILICTGTLIHICRSSDCIINYATINLTLAWIHIHTLRLFLTRTIRQIASNTFWPDRIPIQWFILKTTRLTLWYSHQGISIITVN